MIRASCATLEHKTSIYHKLDSRNSQKMSKQKSYASATRVKHDNAVASVVPNIASERANCLSFTIPKGTKVSIPDVAQALEKLGEGVRTGCLGRGQPRSA